MEFLFVVIWFLLSKNRSDFDVTPNVICLLTLTHLRSMIPPYKNRLNHLQSESVDWFLYGESIGRYSSGLTNTQGIIHLVRSQNFPEN